MIQDGNKILGVVKRAAVDIFFLSTPSGCILLDDNEIYAVFLYNDIEQEHFLLTEKGDSISMESNTHDEDGGYCKFQNLSMLD